MSTSLVSDSPLLPDNNTGTKVLLVQLNECESECRAVATHAAGRSENWGSYSQFTTTQRAEDGEGHNVKNNSEQERTKQKN